MRRLVLAAGSLVADFELAHGGLARTELDEQIARSPFTRTWALYQRVAAPEETLGPRAAPPAALQDSESFASLDVGEPPAVLRREGTPEVATMVAHEARAPALQRVGTPEEPRVGLVATTHRVRLDGDAWARVLEACPDLLKAEVTSDVCDATSLPPTSMRRLVLAAGSLVADFELAHGGAARAEPDEQIARSPFTRTWALYQRVRCDGRDAGPPRCAACRPSGLRELRVTGRRGAAGCAAAGGDAGGGDHGGARGTGASAAARRHTRGAARGLGGHDAPGASGRRRLGARP
nr:unnamed protein product [Leishmania braziliensis]